MNPRLARLLVKLDAHGLDGLLVSHSPNIVYLTGYPSRESYLLVTHKKLFFITDFRYIEEAKRALKGMCQIVKINGSLFKTIAEISGEVKIKQLGFEAKNLNFAEYQKLKEHLAKVKTKFRPIFDLIEHLRKIKDKIELAKIKSAVRITINTFSFLKKILKPGLTERQIAWELEGFMRKNGASDASFDIIVASRANSSLPHAITQDRTISNKYPLLVDMGSIYRCYNSDLTRVIFRGKMNFTFAKIYSIVKTAQEKAIKVIKPGIPCWKIDQTARDYIRQKGYGEFFGHSLGHGVGLEVHEEPLINYRNQALLEEGMVFTVEPGIYLPKRFGIRLEDMVLVTKSGCEVLSGALHK